MSELYDIIAAAVRGESFAILARAGCGKTHALVEIANHLPALKHPSTIDRPHILCVAFSKRDQLDLEKRIPQYAFARTINALCFQAVGAYQRYPKMNGWKVRDIIENLIQDEELRPALEEAVGFCKNLNIMPDLKGIEALDSYMEFEDTLHPALSAILQESWRQCCEENLFDFDDQLLYVVQKNLGLPIAHTLLVDEAQDLSPIQHEIIKRIGAKQRIFVGDPMQAIYGFRGAATGSFDTLVERFKLNVYPLTYTYRCGIEIVTYCQQWVPDFRSASAAHDQVFVLHSHPSDNLSAVLAQHEMGLARTNFLVSRMASACRKASIPYYVIGNDFFTALERVTKRLPAHGSLDSNIKAAYEKRIASAKSKRKVEDLKDQCDSLLEFAKTVNTKAELAKLLQVEQKKSENGIALSTIHRAKGREANSVLVLDFANIESDELRYVACSRARTLLTVVETLE